MVASSSKPERGLGQGFYFVETAFFLQAKKSRANEYPRMRRAPIVPTRTMKFFSDSGFLEKELRKEIVKTNME